MKFMDDFDRIFEETRKEIEEFNKNVETEYDKNRERFSDFDSFKRRIDKEFNDFGVEEAEVIE